MRIMRFKEQLGLLQNTILTTITINANIADKVLMLADFRVSSNETPNTVPSVINDDTLLIIEIIKE